MIKPTRFMNMKFSVLNIAGNIIKVLNTEFSKSLDTDQLYSKLQESLGQDVFYNYEYALCFLYAVGRLTYQQNSNIVKLQGTIK